MSPSLLETADAPRITVNEPFQKDTVWKRRSGFRATLYSALATVGGLVAAGVGVAHSYVQMHEANAVAEDHANEGNDVTKQYFLRALHDPSTTLEKLADALMDLAECKARAFRNQGAPWDCRELRILALKFYREEEEYLASGLLSRHADGTPVPLTPRAADLKKKMATCERDLATERESDQIGITSSTSTILELAGQNRRIVQKNREQQDRPPLLTQRSEEQLAP